MRTRVDAVGKMLLILDATLTYGRTRRQRLNTPRHV